MKSFIITDTQLESIIEKAIHRAFIKLPSTRNNAPLWSERAVCRKYGYGKKTKSIIEKIGVRDGGVIRVDIENFKKEYYINLPKD